MFIHYIHRDLDWAMIHYDSGASFIKHLKPKIFLSSIQTVWNLQKSQAYFISETGPSVELLPLQDGSHCGE